MEVQSAKCKVQTVFLVFLLLFIFASCGQKGTDREEFSTPEKTYNVWIDAGVKGDLAKSMECVTEASQRMMDQQSKGRDEFVRKMVSNSAVFKNFSIIDKRESGEKAIIVIESPDKRARIAVPFLKEAKGWKVDLLKMFGG